ncbi:ATP-binding protein [Paenibacillus eucommiae]|uniref:histidine kinase n=1 Tax=Paenibacillus eucommiae TaxID=1355755 RepID=A0ABS4J799_9BACL|nr:ATP-binding protein [Paenibacillus eucommiae]MBP1994976.1 PAS domain S-box-containing protein [Paenibacillus eucommiae]
MSKKKVPKVQMTMDGLNRLLRQYQGQGVLMIDQEGEILQANTFFLDASGYSADELLGSPISQVIRITDSLQHIYARYFEANMSMEQWEEQPKAFIQARDGRILSHYYSMIEFMQGNRTVYIFLLEDQTEPLQLNLLQQFSDAFLKDVNLGVILIDLNYALIDISDMACRVLGLERSSILNQSMEKVFEAVPIQHQLVQKTILDGMVVRNHAVSWMNDQERYELLLDSNVLKDNQGQIVGAYLIFKDVTNLRSLEEMVQRSDRLAMIGQIAAGTAHEIRNPLTSIKGFLQVLRRTFEVRGMNKEQGYTEVMLTEINRINELVSEFLLLSKPKHVIYEQTDVSLVLREILPIINNEAILYKVHLQYEAAYHLPLVIADQELLKQVFLNLCKNGIEAMVDGGILTITEKLDLEERKVSIEIHDTGPGIPVFVIDKIFDPFFTTKDSGTGLGLSVCQRIIHDMGGSIRVASKGFGTTFTVSIPYS